MKHKFLMLVGFAIAVVFMLVGCFYPKGTPAATGIYEPVYIADANVPLAWMVSPGHFDRVTELERDNYGRVYYSYRPPAGIYNSSIDIHIISQSVKDDQVLYYPDICYMIRLEDDAPLSQEQIDQLKQLNDWNLPIKEEKTYRVSNTERQKDIANEEEVESAVLRYLNLEDTYGVGYNGLEIGKKYEQLYFVKVFPRDENNKISGEPSYYLMVYRENMYRPIILCQQVEDPLNMQEQIIRFRAGWMEEQE